jgi:hypothetical protein
MKKVLILTLVLFITVSVVVILGNVITIGEKFTTVFGTSYVEYAFYLLLIGLFAKIMILLFINNKNRFFLVFIVYREKNCDYRAVFLR